MVTSLYARFSEIIFTNFAKVSEPHIFWVPHHFLGCVFYGNHLSRYNGIINNTICQAPNYIFYKIFTNNLQKLPPKHLTMLKRHAVALHFMYLLHFARVRNTLTPKGSIGIIPAMVAGVSDHILTVEEIISSGNP